MIDLALQLFLSVTAQLVVWLRPVMPMVCAAIAWLITAMLALNVIAFLRGSLSNARKLHRIPCADCRYATRDYHLKCPVRPREAFTEQAISCLDFESAEISYQPSTSGPAKAAY
ncbi:MAG: hypothetical protein WBD47_18860 [Phormidesmis sp.]